MKMTVSVNLGGVLYAMDEDASDLLKGYLANISGRIADPSERKDIMADIEARLTEIFRDLGVGGSRVVTLQHVQQAIAVIGPADVFGKTCAEGRPELPLSERKRLLRDPKDRVLGGLCSGVALYFAIDTLLVRLAVVLLTFLGGVTILVYFILWIVVPLARSPRDLELLDEMRLRRAA